MKKLLSVALSLCLMLMLSTCTGAKGEAAAEEKAMALMISSVISGDKSAGAAAEHELESLAGGGKYPPYEQLYTLSRFMASQTPVGYPSEALLICIGQVALNRQASPNFPDSLSQVCAGLGADAGVLEQTRPSRTCVDAAMKLLEGERPLSQEVLYFSGEKSGEPYAAFYGKLMGYTYFY